MVPLRIYHRLVVIWLVDVLILRLRLGCLAENIGIYHIEKIWNAFRWKRVILIIDVVQQRI